MQSERLCHDGTSLASLTTCWRVPLFGCNAPDESGKNIGMDSNNWLRQMLVMGIGTTSIVAETLREVSSQWVRDGKIDPDRARDLVDDLMLRLGSDTSDVEAQMERQLRNLLQDFGVARQTETDELRGRIDRLERQVRELEDKLWRKPPSNETNLN